MARRRAERRPSIRFLRTRRTHKREAETCGGRPRSPHFRLLLIKLAFFVPATIHSGGILFPCRVHNARLPLCLVGVFRFIRSSFFKTVYTCASNRSDAFQKACPAPLPSSALFFCSRSSVAPGPYCEARRRDMPLLLHVLQRALATDS